MKFLKFNIKSFAATGIVAKLIFSITAVLVISFVAVAIITSHIQRSSLNEVLGVSEKVVSHMAEDQISVNKESEQIKVEQLTKLLTKIAPAAIANVELSTLQDYASVASADPDISYVSYLSADGSELATAGEKSSDNITVLHSDIIFEEEKLGQVVVGFNHSRSNKQIATQKASIEADRTQLVQLVENSINTVVFTLIAMLVGTALFAIVVVFFATKYFTRPLKVMKDIVKELREGDGDLTRRLPDFGNDEIGQTATDLNGFIEKIHNVLSEIRSSVNNMTLISSDVSSAAQILSQGSTEQAVSIERTSSSIEQISSSISQNAENSRVTSEIASKVSCEASDGGDAVKETVVAMKEITERISMIEDIAYKTNLLALNAAIEAARAGEHGKGFAVVADEVRKLAERSQFAAQEISELAKNSVNIATRAGDLIESVVPNIQKTANLVKEIDDVSETQALSVREINQAIIQLDSVAQKNSAAAEEMASTADEMSSQVTSVNNSIGFFKLRDIVAN